jgi:hypothetical protein
MRFVRSLPLALSLMCLISSLSGCQSSRGLAVAAPAQSQWSGYGENVAPCLVFVSLGALKGDEQGVAVAGVITEVCNHQGCWLRLNDPKDPAVGDLFVRTKDHAFFVPRNAHGHNVMVYGSCEFTEVSVGEQQHYAEEAGKSEAEIAKITQPRKMIIFHADSIMIEGPGLEAPVE